MELYTDRIKLFLISGFEDELQFLREALKVAVHWLETAAIVSTADIIYELFILVKFIRHKCILLCRQFFSLFPGE